LYDETRQAWAMLIRQGRLKRFKGRACYTSCRSTDVQPNLVATDKDKASSKQVNLA